MEAGRINRKEAAALLGVSGQTVANLAERGALSITYEGKWSYFSREEVLALIPKTQSLRDIEKAIAETEELLEQERRNGVTTAMIYKARRDFIESITDRLTFDRYCKLVRATFMAVESSALLGEKMTRRELEVLNQILDLVPVSQTAESYDLTPERVRQIFERALRKMMHFSRTIGGNFDELKRRCDEQDEKIHRLRAELEKKESALRVWKRQAALSNPSPDMPIEEFGLSARTKNCLGKVDIRCLGDLASRKRRDLLRIRNLGKKSIAELDALLDRYGLQYGMTKEELKGHGINNAY